MSVLLSLYKLKVKLFFGALRVSKGNAALLAVYVLSFVPTTFGMTLGVVDSVRQGVDLRSQIDTLAAMVSGFLVLVLASTLKGFTAFEFEQSFIFTSPISPRLFLIASLLADITVFSFFFYPVIIFLGAIAVLLNLSPMTILSMIFIVVPFVSLLVFLKSSLSILGSVYKSIWIKIFTLILIVLLLFPATGLLINSPLRYSENPYPSTLLAEGVIDCFYDRLPSLRSFLGSAAYFFASLGLFIFSSKKNFFHVASSVPMVSPFDTSMRMQTVKMGRTIKFFSRTSFGITLDLEPKSLLGFLMKKEFIRMVRDGSLFAVFLFYIIVSIITMAVGSQNTPFQIPMLLLGIYSLIVPSMLIANWRITELDNLWIPLTCDINIGVVIRSLLYDLTLLAFGVPALTIVLLTLISQLNPLLPLVWIASVSMIGCSTNLYVVVRFLGKKRKATPSLIINWMSLVLSGLLLAPTYIFVLSSLLLGLSNEVNLLLSIPIVAYSAYIMVYLAKKSERSALSLEI